MALDFPASPTNGQVFLSGGISWTFDGEKWKVATTAATTFIVDGGNFATGGSLASSSTDINGGSFD